MHCDFGLADNILCKVRRSAYCDIANRRWCWTWNSHSSSRGFQVIVRLVYCFTVERKSFCYQQLLLFSDFQLQEFFRQMSEQFINALYTEEVISTEFLLPEVFTHLVTLLTGDGAGPEILTHHQKVFASVRTVYCRTVQRKSFCYQQFLLPD